MFDRGFEATLALVENESYSFGALPKLSFDNVGGKDENLVARGVSGAPRPQRP